MIFLNLKTYKEASGDNALKILSSVKKISQETEIPIIAIVQPTDIYRIRKELDIEVWAQHIDPVDPGKTTGWISPLSIKEAGAGGVLINHSEHKLPEDVVKKTVEKCKQYGLKTMVIGQSPEMVIKYDLLETDFVSYEKEDLIAGNISMIDQQEEAIKNLVEKIRHPLIIGAGINDKEDIKKTKATGATGVLLATSFVTANDPEVKLRELVSGFLS